MSDLINATDSLNTGRVKINAIIEDASATAGEAQTKANEALEKSNNTQAQLDQVVIEGDSSVESAQARVDSRGVTHQTLKSRIDNFQISTDNKFNLDGFELQNKKRKLTPLVTFVDDDGRVEVLTKLLPLAQTYNIPMVVAAIGERSSSAEGYTDFMKQDDLLMLQDLGWEISGHTQNHLHLGNLPTYAEKEYQLKVGKETLENMGLKVTTLCYPFSGRDDDTIEIARKYYRCGRITDSQGRINLAPLETFDMPAMPLGAYFDPWATPPFPTNTLDYYKWSVDQAVANNGWLIIMTHCGETSHDATQQQYLEQTIQYIQSLNIDVVTLDDGLNRRGNLVDIGRYYTGSSVVRKHLAIGADGSYVGSDLQNVTTITNANFPVTNATPPKAFSGRKLYHTRVSTANHTGFPTPFLTLANGTLITDTTAKTAPNEGYAHQTYKPVNLNTLYRRYEIDEDTWSPWMASGSDLRLATNAITLATSGKTGFAKNHITTCLITADLTGAPEGKSGLLTTNKASGHDWYIYQTYEVSDSANLYRRYWLEGTSVWGSWLRVTPIALTTAQRNAGTLVRNVGDMVFDTTLGKPVWLKTQPNIWVDATGVQV